MSGTRSIVCLGSAPAERQEIDRSLAAAGLAAHWADGVSDVLARLDKVNLPVVVDLSRGAAIHHIREIHAARPRVLTFAAVDSSRPDLTTEAVLAGVADVFTRPLDGGRVARAVDREATYAAAIEARRDLEGLPQGDLYGQSASMREVLSRVAAAATVRTGLLIRGEYGSGRELIARILHRTQGRETFITLDCADHEADALERMLFGNRSTAGRPQAGHPERLQPGAALHRANGGTLYLHNVTDMPTRVQARLARALRDQEIEVRESTDPVTLDVRLVAATEDDALEAAANDGRLRDDLHRRLARTVIDVPPLRQRREDIGPLANFFVRQVCARLRVPAKTLSRPALSLIVALPWRRNAVELRSMIENVVRGIAGGRGIGLDDVLSHVSLGEGLAISSANRTLREARQQFEREYIVAVLERHHGRITEAARTLGVQRTNLYRKMRELKVDRTRRR